MRTAALALTLFSAAYLLHWAVWRTKVPRRQSAALLAILLGTLPAGLAIVTFVPALQILRPHGIWELVQVSTFHVAMSLAYVVAYSAIAARSPSMTLLMYVADSGSRGRTHAELQAVLCGEDPVALRLGALLDDQMISEERGEYVLTSKGWAWSRGFGAFRKLLGMEIGG